MKLVNPSNPDICIEAVIFDKDGTLLDIDATWGRAMSKAIKELFPSTNKQDEIAEVLGLDIHNYKFLPHSLIPLQSPQKNSDMLIEHLDVDEFEKAVIKQLDKSIKPAEGALELVEALTNNKIKMSLATNDKTENALTWFEDMGWTNHFTCVYGYDSGYGSKPNPKMLVECAKKMQVPLEQIIMVGDTTSDLLAAKSAGISYIQVGELNNWEGEPPIKINNLNELIPLLLGN